MFLKGKKMFSQLQQIISIGIDLQPYLAEAL